VAAESGFEARLGRSIATYVDRVRQHASLVLLIYIVAALPMGWYAATHLGVNSDANALFSENVPHRARVRKMGESFPVLQNPMIVVIDGPSQSTVRNATNELTRTFQDRDDLFSHVFAPSSEPFFRRNGLLFLSIDELDDFADQLARIQPYLGTLTRDPSLRGFFGLLRTTLQHGGTINRSDLETMLVALSETLDGVSSGKAIPFAWDETIAGKRLTKLDRRQVIVLQPVLDDSTQPAREPIEFVRERAALTSETGEADVEIRLTGELVLMHDDVQTVDRSIGNIVMLSLSLVSLVLFLALRSWRLIVAVIGCLFLILVQTATFAAWAVGSLNIISSAFSVLVIGLSVDFGLHLCITYQRRIDEGQPHDEALRTTGEMVGTSLLLCAFTTSIAFLAFQFTDFVAIAELGLICGAGMAVSLVASLSVIPAVLTLWPPPTARRAPAPLPGLLESACEFPSRHRRPIIAFSVVLSVGALAILPKVNFNSNPVEVRDPTTESAELFRELLEEDPEALFSMHFAAPDRQTAEEMVHRLEDLEVVGRAHTIYDFIPLAQQEKLEVISDIRDFTLPGNAPRGAIDPPDLSDNAASLRALVTFLEEKSGSDTGLTDAEQRLRVSLGRFAIEAERGSGAALYASLEESLTGSLMDSIDQLYELLSAEPIGVEDIPDSLRSRFVATDGRLRVVIEPASRLDSDAARRRFVDHVSAVAPQATGMVPETIETGAMVARALQKALSFAVIVIILLLLILWRRLDDMLRVMFPLLLGAVLTCAAMVLFGMSFNFANVIVLPLMLGIGVDTGIHLVHRARFAGARGAQLLRTETTRAVIYSNLTSLASFGSLGIAEHLGMASIGRLLFVGISFILVTNLVLLPALLERGSSSRMR
jgi:hopanoid biosynthesis associated RND transporter like protein HpnN